MFERFTDRARRAVVHAQQEARMMQHQHIGTEHVLLGLLGESEGLAALALRDAGLDVEAVRREVEERIGVGTSAPSGHMPFTPRAKNVLELSLRESLKLNHKYIGTEHILLGMLAEGEGVAALILLARVDGGLDTVREKVVERMTSAGSASLSPEEVAQMQDRAAAAIAQRRGQMQIGSNDEVVKRLEAIEARLSSIEQLLRDEPDEASG